ncbi:PD-(D/E)XK nuclease family protein [Pedobacter heparinus]|uniref:ATP-dependent nuclease subunit B n=1 Tax=Pedobacter heparinus (strain ATCC 13125 / DSM 2366 / CIP 104194 / JCM 7457 / NBRC 12017 / NCIMB 9290 / NRRL B-14731 / HIM 762-3) TaxID=485917 RepID=C6XX64_PEDHD|nr:PD-(D/E)XK nuclease family protein [Pedobacter heparinus]ACU06370.1 ATP-dependent nuclease subunit B [Pedobacter heparinus DSM 2366]
MKPFLQEVAADLVARFGDGLQHCAIIFNNKRPAAYLQKHLADLIKKPFFSPSFFTVQEFFAKWTNYRIADFYIQFFTLHKIYNQLLKEEGMESISGNKFFPLAKIILADFAQIDIDLVDADKIYRDLEDISVINKDFDYLSPEQYQYLSQFWTSYSEGKHKRQQELFIKMWRRMPKLYHQFHTALKEQGFVTNGAVYRGLAEGNAGEQNFIKGFDKGKIIFAGFNALSNAEAKVFVNLQKAGKALFYFDADSYYLDDPLQEAGLFLRKNIYQLGIKNVFENNPSLIRTEKHCVDVYSVQGQTAQAKILNNILKEDYANEAESQSVVVVLADESLLIPTLQTIPTNHNGRELELNVTMGFALAASGVYGLIDLWSGCQLEIQQTGRLSYKNVEAFLTHPLTGLRQAMRDKINTALLAEKEIEVPYTRLVNQKGLFEVFFKKLLHAGEVMEQLLEVMNFVLARLSHAGNLKKIDAELFAKAIQELNRLYDTFGKHVDHEEIPFIISLVQKAVMGLAVPLSGDPLKGIQVMGLLETRNLNFDKVVMLGFNEGIVPKSSVGNSFIPDSIRRVYGLPVLENQDAISAYMVYRLIQRASDVSFVYNSLTDDATSGEPSRILKQLAYESGFEFNYHTLDLNVRTEPLKEITIKKEGNEAIQQGLQRYLNKQKTLSPSALTQYILNPIDFFFNYIAGIKEPKEISAVVEANEVGSILHKVMEYFYKDCIRQEITLPLLKEKRKKIPALTQKAFAAVIFNNPEKQAEFKGMQKVILAIVEAYVNIIVSQDERQTPFMIESLEQWVEADISFPLGGRAASIRIGGIIDRVDLKDGITRIIDYKTGSDKLNYKDIPELFNTDGKHINKALIQTLLYTYIYEQFSGKTAVEPNLYVVKTMSQEGVWFKSGRQSLSGSYLEEVKPEFLSALKEKLTELFEAPYFKSSIIEDNYKYSIYKTLFGK